MNYELSLVINSINFKIIMNSKELFEEQKQILLENIYKTEKSVTETIIIYYTKNEELFKKINNSLSVQNLKKINTFKNQNHFQGYYNGLQAFKNDRQEYIVLPAKNQSEFNLIGNPSMDTSFVPYYLIIELLIRKMEERNEILSHATGVTLNKNGILITNKSGSGKTTLMNKIFEGGDEIGLLSNDRVFSSVNNKKYLMKYVPCQVKYEIGTLRGSQQLMKFFRNETLDKKVGINLSEMPSIFPNLKLVEESPIDIIFIPKIDSNTSSDKIKVENIKKEEAISILLENSFTPEDKECPREPWLYQRKINADDLHEQVKKIIESETRDVPIHVVKYGAKAKSKAIVSKISDFLP